MSAQLNALAAFKEQSVRRAATERLAAAELTAEKSRETIVRTNDTIDELNARLKTLRAKLKKQRQDVGKEPTKQSAAKILRTESQIDSANEKLDRAQKRLAKAQRRLAAASDDADVARRILDTEPEFVGAITIPNPTDVMVSEPAPVPSTVDTDPKPIQAFEPKANDMADEEVKPLFDTDPEILDEEIAFKPIEFDAPAAAPVMPQPAPISFTPPASVAPVATEPVVAQETIIEQVPDVPMSAPVLDAITSVEVPNTELYSEFDAPVEATPEIPMAAPVPPAPVMPEVIEQPQPVPQPQPTPAPMPEISPAPNSAGVRPLSPITGVATPEPPVQRKPTMLYYVMLIILIVLSIFTLWIYQKSTNKNTPNLAAKTQPMPAEEIVKQPATEQKVSAKADVASPFVETVSVAPTTAPKTEEKKADAPVVQPKQEVEPAPVQPVAVAVEPEPAVSKPEPVAVETVAAVVEMVPVTAEPVTKPVVAPIEMPTSPFVSDEVVTKKIPTEAEILASKPAYNVSQQEKMFVAEVAELEYVDEPVAMPEPAVVTESVDEGVEMCAGGVAPDTDGCCPGEYLTDMDDGSVACCADGTDECFPPMF